MCSLALPLSNSPSRCLSPLMAPYFIRNLIPKRETRDLNRRPLLEVLRSLTWIQWAQFFSGYVSFPRATTGLIVPVLTWGNTMKMARLDLRRY